jgi:hypothetical protein
MRNRYPNVFDDAPHLIKAQQKRDLPYKRICVWQSLAFDFKSFPILIKRKPIVRSGCTVTSDEPLFATWHR